MCSHCTVVYDFTRTRQQYGPANWLKGYKGYLIADAYAGYDHLVKSGELKEVACWAHVRRKFFEATIGVKNPHRAHWVVTQIKKLATISVIGKFFAIPTSLRSGWNS